MKKFKKFALALLTCAALCVAFTACGGSSAKKTANIPNVEKGYFAGLEEASCVTVNLSDYVDANGAKVTYTAESSDKDIATVKIEDNVLFAKLEGKEGNAVITVSVNSNGKKSFDLSFKIIASVYQKVACIGDSLTYGHSWHDQSYPVYLQEILGEGVEVRNFGVNGSAVTNRNEPSYQLKYDTLQEYADSVAFGPDIAVIMLGTNDGYNWTGSAPNFEEEYRKLIDSYFDNGVSRIILMTSPPVLEGNAFNLPNDVINTQVCPRQRALAEEYDIPLVDLRAAFEARQDMQTLFRTGDGVHFSVDGARFVAQATSEALFKL